MASTSSDEACRAFLAAQGVEAGADELAAALEAAIARAAEAWPDLRADWTAFAAFLGERIAPDVDPAAALRDRAIGDLYLAFACLAGDPQATRHLEDRYLSLMIEALVQQGLTRELARDTVQQLSVKLLTGERRILGAYSGIGALKAWLRVTVLREAVRANRRERAHEGDEVTDALADAAGDPALQYQRRLYQDQFRSAFADAFASLSVRERNLLKQSVLYGATADDLGALYQVHRATAARWVAAARDRLAEVTRNRMIDQFGVPAADYDSVLQLIHSQLDVSVTRVLGGRPGTA